ncbi:MAG: exo-alpha-sialidase [Planctomycetes bacterium]|nr:exo-alpha-sialidase [Planctomycetota bacterium]
MRFFCCPLLLLLSVSASAAEPSLEKVDVFPAGMNKIKRYRIPGIVVTKKGAVLAYCEARKNGSSDWGEIEVHLRRSTDGGKTWANSQHIAHKGDRIEGNPHKKTGGEREQTVNNPVAMIDRDTGDIVFLYCVNYARCFAMRSMDDGKTWSKPTEITEAFVPFRKKYDWKVIATGPGHGIQIKSGRLVVPIWLAFGKVGDHAPSAAGTIYSDDSGKTWKAGDIAVPNEGGFVSPNETMLAECSDGKVMLVSRNYSKPNRKIVAYSPNGATQWSQPEFHKELWEPRCMASLVAYPSKPGMLLFSNPHTVARDKEGKEVPGAGGKRENLSIKISRDDGKTWPVRRTLDAGPSAYSDLAILPDGDILCLYEAGSDIKAARFPLAWVEAKVNGEPKPANRDELPASKMYAWYRQDGVKARGATVTEWETAVGTPAGRSLTHIVGTPKAVRVGTPSGDRTVVRFDGKAALWQTSASWGSLSNERTVVAYLRLAPKANGFLFDGSTNTGMTRAQIRDGKWQVGVQPPPIKNADLADVNTHEAKTGEWQVHTWTIKKSAKGTNISHYQGDEQKTVTTQASSPLSGFILGANVTTKVGLKFDMAEVIVYDRVVDATELKTVATYLKSTWGNPTELPPEKQPKTEGLPDDPRLFRTVIRKNGDDNVHTYRIPGLATTPKGTLIAVFDIRNKSGADLPGDIDVGMMRSTDDGKTWSAMKRIMDYDAGVAGSRGNGVGDPAILVDRKTGTIFVAALWSKGNRAWFGSGPGLTPDETGQFVICQSTDDGLTWSKPVSITPQVMHKDWLLCFQGPGNGIQLKDGTLVFPAQYKGKDKIPHSCFVASSDGGKNWTISPPAVPGGPPTSESAIAQLADGSLLLSMRNESRGGKRVWARWEWKDTITKGKWSEHWLDVTDPTCMASLISHPHGELILSNPNNAKRRDHLTIRTSKDSGKTWSSGKLLDPGTAMYSCLTVLKDGSIGIVYENGEGLVFIRFPLAWLKEKVAPPAPPSMP